MIPGEPVATTLSDFRYENQFPNFNPLKSVPMAGTERQREIRRLRTRRKKTKAILEKAKKANPAVKAELARKLRKMTPGADVIIQRAGLLA